MYAETDTPTPMGTMHRSAMTFIINSQFEVLNDE
jgi:hypothetical protein